MKIEIADILVDKVLEISGALAIYKDDIADHKTILIDADKNNFNGLYWFEFYSFLLPEHYDEWQDFCCNFIQKNNPDWNTREIVEEFKIYDLFFGLKK